MRNARWSTQQCIISPHEFIIIHILIHFSNFHAFFINRASVRTLRNHGAKSVWSAHAKSISTRLSRQSLKSNDDYERAASPGRIRWDANPDDRLRRYRLFQRQADNRQNVCHQDVTYVVPDEWPWRRKKTYNQDQRVLERTYSCTRRERMNFCVPLGGSKMLFCSRRPQWLVTLFLNLNSVLKP